jgi:hypothetical protein
VLWIRFRIRSDPKLIEISGSETNYVGSRQLRIRMNLRQFFNKNAQFKIKNSFLSQKNFPAKLTLYLTHIQKRKRAKERAREKRGNNEQIMRWETILVGEQTCYCVVSMQQIQICPPSFVCLSPSHSGTA